MTCDWAACRNPGDMQDDEGWWHCAEHWASHRALQLEAAGIVGAKAHTRQTRRQVVEMVADGMDSRSIADQLGVTIGRVTTIRREEGCPERWRAS